ncbi:hypothetical protein PUNSTDRAFT_137927 [Punctularia strigosozonata HHB-11173 SS5]|uniref:Uncharacterized protein n=1 Tax=Punctularia strigosozonata (strain HHB-11173) TaxID=741275 RepID=R7S4F3_PUNST|nr:uncharacterized protein PUNSTDRAFT_137927 [Punctularia strigosozonata HHB-11173 SS5]EIN05245.1 hypothetical protein PUNSTDRAFT_137927 [Punctularia strigosozonata HHB-11173 SS5]
MSTASDSESTDLTKLATSTNLASLVLDVYEHNGFIIDDMPEYKPGSRWTSAEDREFLDARKSGFLAARRAGKKSPNSIPHFMKRTWDAYWERFPEAIRFTPKELAAVGEDTAAASELQSFNDRRVRRQVQIHQWLLNKCRNDGGSSAATGFDKLKASKPKNLQKACFAYADLYPQVKADFASFIAAQELAAGEGEGQGTREGKGKGKDIPVNDYARWLTERLEKESPEVKQAVEDYRHKAKQGYAMELANPGNESDLDRALRYDEAIKRLPELIQLEAKAVNEASGFISFRILGGPTPGQDGAFTIVAWSDGRLPDGRSFEEFVPDYQGSVFVLFAQYLDLHYSLEDRAKISLRRVNNEKDAQELIASMSAANQQGDSPRQITASTETSDTGSVAKQKTPKPKRKRKAKAPAYANELVKIPATKFNTPSTTTTPGPRTPHGDGVDKAIQRSISNATTTSSSTSTSATTSATMSASAFTSDTAPRASRSASLVSSITGSTTPSTVSETTSSSVPIPGLPLLAGMTTPTAPSQRMRPKPRPIKKSRRVVDDTDEEDDDSFAGVSYAVPRIPRRPAADGLLEGGQPDSSPSRPPPATAPAVLVSRARLPPVTFDTPQSNDDDEMWAHFAPTPDPALISPNRDSHTMQKDSTPRAESDRTPCPSRAAAANASMSSIPEYPPRQMAYLALVAASRPKTIESCSDAPNWLKTAIAHLRLPTSWRRTTCYETLIPAFEAYEIAEGFAGGERDMRNYPTYKLRPRAVGWWQNNKRGVDRIPVIDEMPDFLVNFVGWYKFLNPKWRGESMPFARTEGKIYWGSLPCNAKNGFYLLIMTLKWGFFNAKTDEQFATLEEIAGDMEWSLKAMTAVLLDPHLQSRMNDPALDSLPLDDDAADNEQDDNDSEEVDAPPKKKAKRAAAPRRSSRTKVAASASTSVNKAKKGAKTRSR